MLEIVHDLAPVATLGFATAFDGQASFAQNIRNLRNVLGCHVLVDDVGYFAEPAFQDGIIAQAVNAVVASGALYFSSAGNEGNSNDGTSGLWEGDFVPGTAVQGVGITHNFLSGVNVNTITAPTSVITLQWSDPWGSSANDYDLYLLNPSLTQVVASSNTTQNGTGNPFEQINVEFNPVGYGLVIAKFGGANRFLRLNTHRGRLAIATPGQTYGHSAAVGALSIAAVNVANAGGGVFVGGAANPVETFSADGPRRIFFNANGSLITPGNVSSTGGTLRQKPDFAAADGGATATPGFNPFFGTSAAAPHAAAIGGLVLSAHPTFTPAQVRQALTVSALDIESPGWDRDSGFGIINAFVAINAFAGTGRVLHNFNGDTRADLLWRHSPTGTVFMWLMNGVTIGQSSGVATVSDLGWQISGGGDLNGDTRADVVWRHSVTGEVAVWLMNGPGVLQAAIVAQVADLNWRIVGVGDLNGDGRADLVWRHSVTGQVAGWLMNGLGVLQTAIVAQVADLGWQIDGVGDLNGDGRADLVWRHSVTGQVAGWLMNGLGVLQAAIVAQVADLGWQIVGVGDLNGDGRADLAWRHGVTGQVAGWLMNGLGVLQAAIVAQVADVGWQIVGVGDLNGDGRADLAWRHSVTGQVVGWLMNGLGVLQATIVAQVADLSWQPQR